MNFILTQNNYRCFVISLFMNDNIKQKKQTIETNLAIFLFIKKHKLIEFSLIFFIVIITY